MRHFHLLYSLFFISFHSSILFLSSFFLTFSLGVELSDVETLQLIRSAVAIHLKQTDAGTHFCRYIQAN